MSEQALQQRERRRRAMLPGGPRDTVVQAAKWLFPIMAMLLFVLLVGMPLLATQEFSFLLSKDSAARASERMRMQEASYRGETALGEPFEITAGSGVQKSSAVPLVMLTELSARIEQAAGPATVTAPSGEFNIDANRLLVAGPVVARSASGFSLDGSEILVDINRGVVRADSPVSGTLPLGTFAADGFSADVQGRSVTLTGNVRLKITPNRSQA